jgi:beta-galactosidase
MGAHLPTGIFSDILEADSADAKVLASYDRDFYKGTPALVETKLAAGKVLHFGGTFTMETVTRILEYAGILSPFQDSVDLPESCELAVREKDGKRYLFLLNYAWEKQQVLLKQPVKDLDSGLTVQGQTELPAFGTKIYLL